MIIQFSRGGRQGLAGKAAANADARGVTDPTGYSIPAEFEMSNLNNHAYLEHPADTRFLFLAHLGMGASSAVYLSLIHI